MLVPDPREIRITLERRLYDVLKSAGVKLSSRNKQFDPKGEKLWARAVSKLGRPMTLEKGENALGRRPGVFLVQLFLFPDEDIALAESLCAKVEEVFRLRSIGGVHCEEPYTEDIGRDKEDAWYQFNVTIPFWTWVGE